MNNLKHITIAGLIFLGGLIAGAPAMADDAAGQTGSGAPAAADDSDGDRKYSACEAVFAPKFENERAKLPGGTGAIMPGNGQTYTHSESASHDESEDYASVVRLWKPLAERGDMHAQLQLGVMYYRGLGTPNYAEAMKWWRLAAEQGLAAAQFRLGYMHEAGEGAPHNYVQAYKWYHLANKQGDESAKAYMERLEERMTREQIADGLNAAKKFVDRRKP